jgi:hypothetical protein
MYRAILVPLDGSPLSEHVLYRPPTHSLVERTSKGG